MNSRSSQTGESRSYFMRTILALSLVCLSACGNSPNRTVQAIIPADGCAPNCAPAGGGSSVTKAGETYHMNLDSEVDGQNIAFTIHEPDNLVAGQSYPLILNSHGYSGQRQKDRTGFLAQLTAAGYGVLTLDERGHGESGGTIRILDPDFAGKDWLQVLDWTEQNLEWMEVDNQGVGRMGSYGGSYGGGFQHLIYRVDVKKRLKAMAPDITWNDLRYSLYPNNAFKTFWGAALAGVGSVPPNMQDEDVYQGLIEGMSTNTLSSNLIDLLYRNSMQYICDGNFESFGIQSMHAIPTFYGQSAYDTLFDLTDAYRNYQCMKAVNDQANVETRLWVKPAGHSSANDLGGDSHENCGPTDRNAARLAFFNEHLKGMTNAQDSFPELCVTIQGPQPAGIIVGDITRDATTTPPGTITPQVVINNLPIGPVAPTNREAAQAYANLVANSFATQSPPSQSSATTASNHPIHTASTNDILAGIPTAKVAVTATSPDPIFFIGLSVSTDNGANYKLLHGQVTPIRRPDIKPADMPPQPTDLADFELDIDLPGVAYPLNAGDIVAIQVQTFNGAIFQSSNNVVVTTVNVTIDATLPLVGTGNLPAPDIN